MSEIVKAFVKNVLDYEKEIPSWGCSWDQGTEKLETDCLSIEITHLFFDSAKIEPWHPVWKAFWGPITTFRK